MKNSTNGPHSHDEDTPLLSERRAKDKTTPLPKLQITILMIVQLAEPMTSQCIYPFINELVATLDIVGGDRKNVGYYAGMIQSLFFATQALTVLQWSRLSDRIGRKPVLLVGLFGVCLSMIFFGLSRTFWTLVISRCLSGVLNGNTGVMKSMVGEITDSTNVAQAFALLPLTWAIGVTIGPFIGGTLSRPHDSWPGRFGASFWTKYPYFLPCAISAAFSATAFLLTLIFLKETLPRKTRKEEDNEQHEHDHSPSSASTETFPTKPDEEPLPLRELLTRPVVLSIANYGVLAILDISFIALQPLFFSTPIEFGGLGFSPKTIGLIMGAYGLGNGLLQALLFSRIVRVLGLKRTFMTGISAFLPIFALPPVMNALARARGIDGIVWAVLALQLVLTVIMDMCYGCIYMYITSSAPNKGSLGATNGLAQTTASVVRAIGPAAATSLFALSTSRNLLGGYAVYVILFVLALGGLGVASRLPKEQWNQEEDGERENADQ